MRRFLLAMLLLAVGAWLALSGAVAWALPAGWHLTGWPLSVPGLAAVSPEGARARWSPLDWRTLRLTGQDFTPKGSRLGPIGALDAELTLRGSPSLSEATWRAAGGFVEVRGLSVVWGPLRFSGAGALRPEDDGLRGPLRGRMEGLDGAMALLGRTGIIAPGTRAQGDVELPLAMLRDGRVMLGPLLVATWQ